MRNRLLTLLAAVAVLSAAIRFVFVASVCESGWGFVATQWQDATLGFLGLGHTPVGHLAPSDQADFWLREVGRVISEHPNSPSIHMGAAWVLDSPNHGFLENHVKPSEFGLAFPRIGPMLDEDAISDEQLDPTDVRWWRMRALLVWEGAIFFSDQEFTPRSSDWLAVLEQCNKHDPENALYDYLAALQLWNTSASYDWPADPENSWDDDEIGDQIVEQAAGDNLETKTDQQDDYWILTVHDPDVFALGLERFEQAQQKPFLAIGEAGYPAIAEFLAISRLRKVDQAAIAVNRLVAIRNVMLIHRLWRWQDARADDARSTGVRAKEMIILRQSLRLFDQAVTPKETSALETLTLFDGLRQRTYEAVEKLATHSPTIIDPSELDSIRKREEELRIEASTLQSALLSLGEESIPKQGVVSWPALLAVIACTSAAVLLFAAKGFILAAKLLSNRLDDVVNFGLLRQAIAWCAGFAITFMVLGMGPAEMISRNAQRIAAFAGVWMIAALVAAAVALWVFRRLRKQEFRFRLVALFAAMTGAAVLASVWHLIPVSLEVLASDLLNLWPTAKGFSGVDAETVRMAMNVKSGSLFWATLQWYIHNGIHVGLVVALLTSALWFMFRSARNASQWFLSYWRRDRRAGWSVLFFFIGEPAFVAAMCFLFLYRCVAPDAIRRAEAEFQYRMKYCRNPLAHWAEIRDAQTAERNSPRDINAIREQVRFEMFGEGALEQDFGPLEVPLDAGSIIIALPRLATSINRRCPDSRQQQTICTTSADSVA